MLGCVHARSELRSFQVSVTGLVVTESSCLLSREMNIVALLQMVLDTVLFSQLQICCLPFEMILRYNIKTLLIYEYITRPLIKCSPLYLIKDC